jgi:hypothetical protein
LDVAMAIRIDRGLRKDVVCIRRWLATRIRQYLAVEWTALMIEPPSG